MKKSWVQDPETGKLVPKEEWRDKGPDSPTVLGDIEAFVSPIDGSHITSRSRLRAHNKLHGVTDSRDYSDSFLRERSAKRINEMTGQPKEARADRIALIRREMEK